MRERYQIRLDMGFTTQQHHALWMAYTELKMIALTHRTPLFRRHAAQETRRLIAAFGEPRQ